ncbi:2-succinyl-6-hydroxy-2,4-cyclohexadiene-1-carboxylate synthase [Mesobacillus harenae]|uniref:2-succinyl-6-hydroxy-2, 4-cyclohexadiene-1-carboxylate synthase n=1 Tax=Mesobacillus harenae TaxID=2213203 RepID=UPI0015809C2C|nr:2-succinyl-6-hydroxy-2,4-cyclohexadiene-1-carboxylate synthase [Mesobacillus harenae]
MEYVIGGVKHHVELCQDGFPLLCLHGFTGSASTWKPFCEKWGKHSMLLMPDIIGHGHTDSPDDVSYYGIDQSADCLNQILEMSGIEKADVLGYSMGGRLAITFAVKYPEKVRKLVLESTTPGIRSLEERKSRRRQDETLAFKIMEQGIENFIDYWEQIPLFSSQRNLPEKMRESIRELRLKNNATGLANSLRGMGTGTQPSWWEELRHFNFETLLITGLLDQKFSKIAKEMKKNVPKCQHIQIPGCGHAIHVEEPEKFGTIVSEFLSNT